MQGVGLTLAGGSPVLLAACGGEEDLITAADEANDLKFVQAAQVLELSMVAGYTKVVSVLGPGAQAPVNEILLQEKAHATALAIVIGDLGGKAAAPKSAAEYEQILGLSKITDQANALAFASDIEQMAIYFYIDAIHSLTIGDLRATFTTLATSAAEHDSVLAGIGSPGVDPAKQVPSAFVSGTPPTLALS